MDSKSDTPNCVPKGKIIRTKDFEYTPEPGGLGKVYFSQMLSNGTAIAQVDGLTGQKDTYSSLLQRCIRTAIVMRSKGITHEDIVATCSFNHLNSCVPFIASLFLGVKTTNLDPTISLRDTIYLINQVRPKLFFVVPEAVKLIESALRESHIQAEIVVFGDNNTKGHSKFSEFLVPSEEEKDFVPYEVKDWKETAVIMFSSGTTGLPKGICINHYSIQCQALNFVSLGTNLKESNNLLYRTDDLHKNVLLGFASMYWLSAALTITFCILSKSCRVVVPKYDPNTVWKLISELKVTWMLLAPSQMMAMYKKGRPEGLNVEHLLSLTIGGGPVSKEQIMEYKRILPTTRILLQYGQTEVSGFCTKFQPALEEDLVLMNKKFGSSGKPMPGFSYKVVDPETGKLLGPNQRGELCLKSEFLMNGYYNQDSSATWDSEGWLKTGDVVYYDEDYCFYIVDRIKEMLKFRSWHVPPAIIESVLLTHPLIKSAVVVGLPHSEDGDHPMGVVVLKNVGLGSVSAEEIERYVEERVDDRQKLRGGVKIVDELPLTPSGKIKRWEVKKMALQGLI